MGKAIFITGIDTNIGKSFATGYIAKQLLKENKKVITQKFIQTGNTGISEDIEIHRKIMGINLLEEDIAGTTCPIILSYPASPHLAAKIDNVNIDVEKIKSVTQELQHKYDIVLIEGAGGIMVPITTNYTTLDYIKAQQLPVIIVTSPKLGSINHTLLTLEICKLNNVAVEAIAYNNFNIEDSIISNDTRNYLKEYLNTEYPKSSWIEIPFFTK